MDSNSESDFDYDDIFRKTRIQPVVKLTGKELFEIRKNVFSEKEVITVEHATQETENMSFMKGLRKRKVKEEDENEFYIINEESSQGAKNDSTPVKIKKTPDKAETNLITNYFSPEKKSGITPKKISNHGNIGLVSTHNDQSSPGTFNMHKRLKLGTIELAHSQSDDLGLHHKSQLQKKEMIENKLKSPAKSPVRNGYSCYYCQGLRKIVDYEMKKQKILEMETRKENKKFECLFSAEEQDYLMKFFELPEEACLLFARMLCRKKDWHRVCELEYSDICNDMEEVCKILGENNFFDLNIGDANMESLLKLLKKNDILSLCKSFHIKVKKGKSRKTDLIDAVLENCKTQLSALDLWNRKNKSRTELMKSKILELLGTCVRINSSALRAFNRLLLLFSLTHDLMEDDKWSSEIQTMIAVILEKIIYPQHEVQPTVIFQVRDDFISYEKATKLFFEYEEAVENKRDKECLRIGREVEKEFERILEDEEFRRRFSALPSHLKKYSAGTVYGKILTRYCEQNKRMKVPEELIGILEKLVNQGLFLVVKKGDWYSSLVQAYENADKPKEAVATLRLALKDGEINDVQRLGLQLKGLAMLKKKKNNIGDLASKGDLGNLCRVTINDPPKIEIKAKALEGNEPGCKIVFVEESRTQKKYFSVEEYAISYYKKNGFTEGVHSEGFIIQTIYFIIFFDIIYGTSPPGVFQSHYQTGPTDLFSRSFYHNRKDAIDERLKDVRSWTINDFEDAVNEVIAENYGKNCVISWENYLGTSIFCDIVKCLGLESLAIICERLVYNFKVYRSGFPDLTVWNPEAGTYKFVEVKSSRDKLSPNQRLWLDFLEKNKINCEVCYVKDKASPSGR